MNVTNSLLAKLIAVLSARQGEAGSEQLEVQPEHLKRHVHSHLNKPLLKVFNSGESSYDRSASIILRCYTSRNTVVTRLNLKHCVGSTSSIIAGVVSCR